MLLYFDDDSVDSVLIRRLADIGHDILTPRAAGTAVSQTQQRRSLIESVWRYTGIVEFEWDPKKADQNAKKHDVEFLEAATVFADPLSITVRDPEHSETENRFIIVGYSNRFRPLVVSHLDDGGRVRIISARPLTAERRDYEEEKHK